MARPGSRACIRRAFAAAALLAPLLAAGCAGAGCWGCHDEELNPRRKWLDGRDAARQECAPGAEGSSPRTVRTRAVRERRAS